MAYLLRVVEGKLAAKQACSLHQEIMQNGGEESAKVGPGRTDKQQRTAERFIVVNTSNLRIGRHGAPISLDTRELLVSVNCFLWE